LFEQRFPSWQARLASWWIRRRIKPLLRDMTQLARVRRIFNQALPAPGSADIKPGAVAGEWVRATQRASGSSQRSPRRMLLYLHGGGSMPRDPIKEST
jgi:hypothetical protein